MKLTMYGVGDCAPYRNDLDSSFRHVTETFRNADLTFGQLEAVLSLQGSFSGNAGSPECSGACRDGSRKE